MNLFLVILNALVPHFRVRGHTLWLSQGHPFSRIEIDLRQVAAHKLPDLFTLRLRLLRGQWATYSLTGFRSAEIAALQEVLTRWERQNHLPSATET